MKKFMNAHELFFMCTGLQSQEFPGDLPGVTFCCLLSDLSGYSILLFSSSISLSWFI